MDKVQQELFGEFPRAVGNPHQWVVHSEAEMDVFLDYNNGSNNCYSSICSFLPGKAVADKVSYDLDSPTKESVFYDVEGEHKKVEMMRDDSNIADEVLGDVCDEASLLARESMNNDIPIIGVFTGMGIHMHQLFEPTDNPSDEITSTAMKVIDDLSLDTVDGVPVGDVQRIMRVPNCERVHIEGVYDDKQSIPCGLYTIPLTADELEDCTPQELLDLSQSTRLIDLDYLPERSPMRVFDDYLNEHVQVREDTSLEIGVDDFDDKEIVELAKDLLKMPCMYERIIQPNPGHEVRRNLAVMLFNIGFNPDTAEKFIRRLNWRDFNPSVTKKQLQHIWDNGYADMSCRTMQKKGLCTRQDDPKSCSTYGWSGGAAEWKK